MVENGKVKDTYVIITLTFWTITAGRDRVYGEAQAMITAKDDKETATYRVCGMGHSREQGRTSFRGTNFYETSSNGRISFLSNMVGAFEAEAYENNHSAKVWEWK